MLKDFGKKPIYKILKDDSVYNDVFNKRIARLEIYRSELAKLAGSKMAKEVGKSISLTKDCHQTAENLKSGYVRLAKIFPTDYEQVINQLIAFQMKAATQGKNYRVKIPQQMMEFALASQRKDYEIAKQVLLESEKTGKTIKSILESKFSNDDSLESASIYMTTGVLKTNCDAYLAGVSFGTNLVELAEIFRGLFYIGIVDYHGSELDEGQLQKDLTEFIQETAGVFAPPLVSNLASLYKMMNKLVDIVENLHGTEMPDAIKELIKLEAFLKKYVEALNTWKVAAKSTITSLDNIGKAIKQYQVT